MRGVQVVSSRSLSPVTPLSLRRRVRPSPSPRITSPPVRRSRSGLLPLLTRAFTLVPGVRRRALHDQGQPPAWPVRAYRHPTRAPRRPPDRGHEGWRCRQGNVSRVSRISLSPSVTFPRAHSGKSQQITIENNKGRLTQEEIERMVREAEEFASSDEAQRKRIEALKSLSGFVFGLKSQLGDQEGLGGKVCRRRRCGVWGGAVLIVLWCRSRMRIRRRSSRLLRRLGTGSTRMGRRPAL